MPQPSDAYLPGSPLVARESSGGRSRTQSVNADALEMEHLQRLGSSSGSLGSSRDDHPAAAQLGRQGSGSAGRPALRYGGSTSALRLETDAGARTLHELHHAAQQDDGADALTKLSSLSPPQSQAAAGAKGRWMRARTFVRTTFAISVK